LINGKHIASYREKVDASDSKEAFEANGKHIRYVKLEVESDKPLKTIEFAKGGDLSIPLVFAITVESAKADDH
jgi:hypothetical protein